MIILELAKNLRKAEGRRMGIRYPESRAGPLSSICLGYPAQQSRISDSPGDATTPIMTQPNGWPVRTWVGREQSHCHSPQENKTKIWWKAGNREAAGPCNEVKEEQRSMPCPLSPWSPSVSGPWNTFKWGSHWKFTAAIWLRESPWWDPIVICS